MFSKNDYSLSELVRQFVQSDRYKPKLYQRRIEKAWGEMMGKMTMRYTKSLKIRGKVLYVKIESASLRQELHYAQNQIKTKLNELLGEEYLEEVKIT